MDKMILVRLCISAANIATTKINFSANHTLHEFSSSFALRNFGGGLFLFLTPLNFGATRGVRGSMCEISREMRDTREK